MLPAALVVLALKFWFGSERVTIENGEVVTRSSMLRVGKTRRIPCRDVMAVKVTGAGTNYEIQVVSNDGRKWSALTSIRSRDDAVWAADEMKRAIRIGR